MPGPPPKPDHLRRRTNPTIAMTRLPSNGRTGETPEWPLGKPSKRESELWAQLWVTPQAAVWEELGWLGVVARYARVLVAAEQRDASAGILGEARQLEDRLGLTPMSMLRLRWAIEEDAEPENKSETGVIDIRKRLARSS